MSSIRFESPRLLWLEAFIAVAEKENMSAAARVLGVSQGTVSRHMKALEHWTGRKLYEVGRITDPEDARVNVGLTDDGREFFEIASHFVAKLNEFRTDDAKSNEIVQDMRRMNGKMIQDLESAEPSKTVREVEDRIRMQQRFLDALPAGAPPEPLETFRKSLRDFFSHYEKETAREGRLRPKRPKS